MRLLTFIACCFLLATAQAQSKADWQELQQQFPQISTEGSIAQVHFDQAEKRRVSSSLASSFLEQRTRGFVRSSDKQYHPVARIPYNDNVTLLVFYSKGKGQRQVSVDVWSVNSQTGKRIDSQDAVCSFGQNSSSASKAALYFNGQGFEAETKSNYGGGSSGGAQRIRYKVSSTGKMEMQF